MLDENKNHLAIFGEMINFFQVIFSFSSLIVPNGRGGCEGEPDSLIEKTALEQRGIRRDEFMGFRGKWKGFWDSEMQSTYIIM